MAATWIIRDCTRYKVCPSGRGEDAGDTYVGESDVVHQVAWTCREQVDIAPTLSMPNGAIYVAKRLGEDSIEPFAGGDLVPFAEVTEEQIIEWLHAALNSSEVLVDEDGEAILDGDGQEQFVNRVQQIETAVENEVAAKQPPNRAAGLPWR